MAAIVGSKSPIRFDHICTATGRTRAELTNSETISSSKDRIIATSSEDSTAGRTSGRVMRRNVAHGGDAQGAAARSIHANSQRHADAADDLSERQLWPLVAVTEPGEVAVHP